MENEQRKPSYDIDEEAKAYAEQALSKLMDKSVPGPDEVEQAIKDAYKAGAMATLEYAKTAMLQNVDSFNRQCIVDFMKDLRKFDLKISYDLLYPTDTPLPDEGATEKVIELLKKWGLSDAQIKDIGIELGPGEL